MDILEEKIIPSSDGRLRKHIRVKCAYCGKNVWREKRWIRNSKHCFCSSNCHNIFREKKIKVHCANCGKDLFKTQGYVEKCKTKLFFCTKNCQNQAQHIKKIFDHTKIIHCYKCGSEIEVDSRVSKKLCSVCNPPVQKKRINWAKVLTGEMVSVYQKSLRKYLLKNGIKKNKCEICGITEWDDRPIVIQVHHKDGNRYNNKLDNLEMACPNCHSQTSTWGTKHMVDIV